MKKKFEITVHIGVTLKAKSLEELKKDVSDLVLPFGENAEWFVTGDDGIELFNGGEV